MNDYMRALHQRFFQEPAYTDVREEIELLRRELRAQLDRQDRQDREKLLKLADLGIELREETSLRPLPPGSGWPWGSPESWNPTPSTTRKRSGRCAGRSKKRHEACVAISKKRRRGAGGERA